MTTRAPRDRALSVVVPVLDERDNLERLAEELVRSLADAPQPWEIVFVDDGSTDGSSEILDDLARARRGVVALHLERHAGQSAAFDAGFRRARGELVATLDADLQNDPADLIRLLDALGEHDAAVGYRVERRDRWTKRVQSRIANAVRNRCTGDDIVDTGCSLKLFRAAALDGVPRYRGFHRFLPTHVRLAGGAVVQVPVSHRPRPAGESKYGIARAIPAFVDLLAVCWMKRRRLDYAVGRETARPEVVARNPWPRQSDGAK